MVDHLPAHSAYAEALAGDEELAELIIAHPAPPSAAGPRVSEWSPERAALAEISDKLSTLTAAVIAAAGAKPPRLSPSPRPQVAADRLRERRREADHLSLVARVIPDPAQATADFARLSRQEQPQ